ncbi:hypothetical protein [Nocardioides rubriscoriae]|uniref:hypothetical protein n=1 Tax=Nocardioides rubriscoriae TaxID=642762 RepID=UPI0011DF0962|nr:hypothetical protein [Nocardioides rubriscoriae]
MQLTTSRTRNLSAIVGLIAVFVVAAFLLGVRAGSSSDHVREGDTFGASVTAISADGDSLCVDRPGDDKCGVAILLDADAQSVAVGDQVTITEVWLGDGSNSLLTFYVRRRALTGT